ncbi:MAG: LURP-one-related family protein [Candidatus Dormibacteraeota bacterium]|nr:LURP-one-related family protein [Candidatus Dormibacteraeota bacterium]
MMTQNHIGTWTRYQLHRKLFSIGEDFWIEDEHGDRVFRVDGKVLSIHGRFVIEDLNGSELATIGTKLVALRPTMRIERHGELYATVKKALFTLLRQHYTIQVEDGEELEAEGSITNHEYEIRANGRVVAEISKRWFSLRDTYGVAVGPGQDAVLLLAAAVCIDEMSEREEKH